MLHTSISVGMRVYALQLKQKSTATYKSYKWKKKAVQYNILIKITKVLFDT